MENNTWMEGEGGGSACRLGEDVTSKNANRPRVTWNFHYPTHQLTLFRAPHVGYQRPHHWLSSGLHASLTTFGAGDRQGKAQWMRMPGT